MNKVTIGLIGATGAVGQTVLEILEEAGWEWLHVEAFASERSAGSQIPFRRGTLRVKMADPQDVRQCDAVILATSAAVSRDWVGRLDGYTGQIIDCSSAFRMHSDVPLVVPQINGQQARTAPLVSIPNCSAIILLLAIYPLYQAVGLRSIHVSTYQAVSGAGIDAMHELEQQTRAVAAGDPLRASVFPFPIAQNIMSHDSPLQADGYNGEEVKIREETRKILNDPHIHVSATCIRVPVLRAHTESIRVTTQQLINWKDAWGALRMADYLTVVHDPDRQHFPMPIEAQHQDNVLVGRLRRDPDDPLSWWLMASGDQLRRGAATNALEVVRLRHRD